VFLIDLRENESSLFFGRYIELFLSHVLNGLKTKLNGRELGILLSSRQIKFWLFWVVWSMISTMALAALRAPRG
jgi:hypothetical protein